MGHTTTKRRPRKLRQPDPPCSFVTVWLPDWLVRALRAEADYRNQSVSLVVYELLTDAIGYKR